ncbi:CRISPR-associated endonuclease Cas2, partial [Mangrovihabitans endophyticus]|uniref:CRISPR-associated endonuclease Cas2 n=1 Tax=Mangrovihabitans endophyticus TaxID=1751298 RepID=UPI00166EA804
ALIQMWGNRIQRSVYLCHLDHDDLTDLTDRLTGLIDTRTDAIHILPLCGSCTASTTTLGQATTPTTELYWAVL